MAAEFSNADEKLWAKMRPRRPRGLKLCGLYGDGRVTLYEWVNE